MEPFLDDLRRGAAERPLGPHHGRPRRHGASALRAPGSFDLLWCEGAAYILGLDVALSAWKPLLRPGGVLTFTEPVWLTDDPPATVRAVWAEYEAMGRPEGVRDAARRAGYQIRGDFVLAPEAWWTNYYAPLEARIAKLERAGVGPAGRIVLDEASREIDSFRHHGDDYGYLFMVLEG
jgi:SAM-dependent methyltransferase